MTFPAIVWLAVCALGAALSLKSILVLKGRSPWTIAGWGATVAYFIVAGADASRATPAPAHLDYVVLALLTIFFVIAGIRDEPQATPWYWPTEESQTGAERRATRNK